MKVAIIGASGQLGRDVAAAFVAESNAVTNLAHEQMEVTSAGSVRSALESIRPSFTSARITCSMV
jgi:dTDP-4-dehydrorhamnose reductase